LLVLTVFRRSQILERDLEDVTVLQSLAKGETTSSFRVDLRGFQVLTLKLHLSSSSSKKGNQWIEV
jgi:hypothetical protein